MWDCFCASRSVERMLTFSVCTFFASSWLILVRLILYIWKVGLSPLTSTLPQVSSYGLSQQCVFWCYYLHMFCRMAFIFVWSQTSLWWVSLKLGKSHHNSFEVHFVRSSTYPWRHFHGSGNKVLYKIISVKKYSKKMDTGQSWFRLKKPGESLWV